MLLRGAGRAKVSSDDSESDSPDPARRFPGPQWPARRVLSALSGPPGPGSPLQKLDTGGKLMCTAPKELIRTEIKNCGFEDVVRTYKVSLIRDCTSKLVPHSKAISSSRFVKFIIPQHGNESSMHYIHGR